MTRSTNRAPRAASRPAVQRPAAPPKWRKRFLAALAESSNVTAAAEAAGISLSWVYQTKRDDRDFAEDWLVALCEGYDRLELELLARARSGEVRANGERANVERGTRFDNGTALRLFLAHRETRIRFMAQQDQVSAEEIRASIEEKLARLRDRVLARKAAELAAAPPVGPLIAGPAGAEASGDDV